MGQQRPGHARHLVGERHRHDLEGSPRQELREPGILPGILLGAPQHSDRPDDENAPQVAISLLGDRSELLLAPGGKLPRHQPVDASSGLVHTAGVTRGNVQVRS